MTLEEYMNYFTKEDLKNTKYGAIEYGFLKELKELRKRYNIEVEMCKFGIELLGVYKKALELACERIMEAELHSFCEFKCDKCKYYPNECVSHTKANIEYYLQKAREE